MADLSILIPSRSEMFLARTVADILEHAEGDTEIIAVIDGAAAGPPVPEHPRVHVITLAESIGQRAATNLACRQSTAKYVMKTDAHCAFDQGFDVKLLADMRDNWTMVPLMRNLHVFDWVCPNGHRRYQGPSGPCATCGEPTTMDVVWIAKPNPQSTAMRFDAELHFQYWQEYKRLQKGDLVDTMSLIGACWLLTREKYWELDICDEGHGSWGQQGTEIACKTWLSGGRLVCNKRTWFAHLFRTQGADFSFPYPLGGSDVEKARQYSRKLWLENSWPKAIYPLSWLIEKFWPVPGWTEDDLNELRERSAGKPAAQRLPAVAAASPAVTQVRPGQGQTPQRGIIYYTDNRLDPQLMGACQSQLKQAGLPITSVSLAPLDFGANVVLAAERGILTMFRQILAGLEASDADIIFFAEHDVLYHPSHFAFTPPDPAKVFYNLNVWHVRSTDGHALYYEAKRTSQLCGYRDVLLEHYRERVRRVAAEGYSSRMGFEPGSHHRPERVDDLQSETWRSPVPNIDIKHGQNLTPARWAPEQFRDRRNCQGWQEADGVPGWGFGPGWFAQFVRGS